MNLTGWRYPVAIAGFVGVLGAALYPISIAPMMNPEKYKKVQKITRAHINQEEIQPVGMRVWSDPFLPRRDKDDK